MYRHGYAATQPWNAQVSYASLGSGLLRFDFCLLELLLAEGAAPGRLRQCRQKLRQNQKRRRCTGVPVSAVHLVDSQYDPDAKVSDFCRFCCHDSLACPNCRRASKASQFSFLLQRTGAGLPAPPRGTRPVRFLVYRPGRGCSTASLQKLCRLRPLATTKESARFMRTTPLRDMPLRLGALLWGPQQYTCASEYISVQTSSLGVRSETKSTVKGASSQLLSACSAVFLQRSRMLWVRAVVTPRNCQMPEPWQTGPEQSGHFLRQAKVAPAVGTVPQPCKSGK